MKFLRETYKAQRESNVRNSVKALLICLFMIFFSAAIFCCVFLFVPNGEARRTDAAGNEPTYALYGAYYGTTAAERGTMTSGNAVGYSISMADTKISLSRASSSGTAAVCRAFTAQITVPAHTAYAVDYTFDMAFKSSDPYNCTSHFELLYFGESIDYNYYFSRSLGGNSTSHSVCSLAATTYYPTFNKTAAVYTHPTIYYNNTTDAERTYTTYFGVFAAKTAKASQLTGTVEISSEVALLTQVDVPTLSATLANQLNDRQEYEETYSVESKEFSFVNFDASTISAEVTEGGNYLIRTNDKIAYTRAYDSFEITLSLPEGYCWNDEYKQGAGDRYIVLKINKADPTVEVGTLDICDKSEFLSSDVPMTSNSVPGTVAWASGATVTDGENRVSWLFTPADEDNYNTVSGETAVMVGHNAEYVEKKDATCAATGIRAHYHCLRCGKNFSNATCTVELEDVTAPKLSHEYTSSVIDPTCIAEGYTTYTCSKCGDTYDDDFEPPLGHEYDVNDENSVHWDWTSTTIAKATFTCKRCGATTQMKATIDAEQTDATCVTPGKVVYTAKVTVYDKEYTSQYTATNTTIAHDYAAKEWHWADDFSSASVTYECTYCHDTATTDPIGSESKVIKAATCLEAGEMKYSVTVVIPNDDELSDEKTVESAKLNHDLTHTEAVEAGCTEGGNVEYWYCSLCEKYYGNESCTEELNQDDVFIDAIGHDYQAGEVVAPANGEQGYTVYTCLNCGDSYHDDFVDPDDPSDVVPGGPDNGSNGGETPGPGGADGGNSGLDSIRDFFTHYWQPLVSGICIVLSIIFISLIGYYESKRKKAKKQSKKYLTYSVSAAGLFGLAYATWSIIAYSLIGLAAVLLIGVIIAKVRSQKAQNAMETAARDFEHNKAALAEKKMQEEEKRRREEDRAEEKRRRDEEREARIAAMGILAQNKTGAQPSSAPVQPVAVPAVASVPAQPVVATSQPIVVTAPAPVTPVVFASSASPAVAAEQPVTVTPVQAVKEPAQSFLVTSATPQPTSSDAVEKSELDQKLNELRAELKDDHEHQDRVESFLAMIAGSREQDRAKIREEERVNEERKRVQDIRRAAWEEPIEPTFVIKSSEEYYQRMGYGMRMSAVERERLREMGFERAIHEREIALREREAALREKEREMEREKRERDRYFYPQIPVMPQPYGQSPYQYPVQPSSRELELERELREKDRLLLEKESARAHDLERELALERERVRNLMQSQNSPAQPITPVQAPQVQPAAQSPVVVVPPVVQAQPARRSSVYSPENPFSVNNRTAGNDDR